MNQALVSDVIEWIAEPAGECDRAKLLKTLNQARERFYQMYERLPLFEITECFEVQSFCTDCDNCGNMYRGVTLPRDYQTVEAMWWNDLPVELFSSWREWQRGISPFLACGLGKVDMPGMYSSERDVLPANPQRLRLHATRGEDVGKTVTLRGTDAYGVQRTQIIRLSTDPQFTDHPMRSLGRGNGIVKERTAGTVILAQEDGRVLSEYGPDETIPGYRRIKITGLRNCDARVNIRGARRYFPVYRESDVVETNNQTAFEEMARFLRLNAKVNKDGNDMKAAAGHLAQAQAALFGEKAREIGKSTQAELSIATPSFGPHRLGRGW